MATDILKSVTVVCFRCGNRFQQPAAWLQIHRSFHCPFCDAYLAIEAPARDPDVDDGEALTRLGRPARKDASQP